MPVVIAIIRGVVVRGEVISFKEAEKVYENYKRFND